MGMRMQEWGGYFEMNEALKNRAIKVGHSEIHEVALVTNPYALHPAKGLAVQVDGARVPFKSKIKWLERTRVMDVSVGTSEIHKVTYELIFLTWGAWTCRVYVDGRLEREFEDSYLNGMDMKSRLQLIGFALAIAGALIVFLHWQAKR